MHFFQSGLVNARLDNRGDRTVVRSPVEGTTQYLWVFLCYQLLHICFWDNHDCK
jgi:hypothetical protein